MVGMGGSLVAGGTCGNFTWSGRTACGGGPLVRDSTTNYARIICDWICEKESWHTRYVQFTNFDDLSVTL